jgi:hypothetical protein
LETGHLTEHAGVRADFEGVKTLLERHEIGHCGRLIGSRERHFRHRVGRLEAAGLN